MEVNVSTSVNSDVGNETQDVRILATSFMMYKIGEGINQVYFPILVPFGVVGNVLSFLVMIQKQNRNMSFSLYISVLAITDTIALLIALSRYLNQIMDVDMPPNQSWHCSLVISLVLMTTLSSTLFILNMTFDRFYSIIRPHKAASFNTVKKAKIIIISSVVFSIIFNLPHFWINLNVGRSCIPHGRSLHSIQGKIYYWLSFIVNFIFPFISLLIMNSVIIHTLRKRSNLTISEGQCQGQGQTTKMKLKNSERQIYSMLLLVTFGFLTLTTPVYFMTLYVNVVNFRKSPFSYAGYFLFYQVGQKTFYTNYGINFYLYVISGQKFRADLVKLFKCNDVLRSSHAGSVSSEINTVTTTT